MKNLLLIIAICQLVYSETLVSNQKEILYKEFLNKREQREIQEVDKIEYFQIIEYEKFPSLSFAFSLSKDKIKDRYIKVFYKDCRAIKMRVYDVHNPRRNAISYLDEKVREVETYYDNGLYAIINYNSDGSKETVFCKNRDNQKVCKIMWRVSEDKDVIHSAHGVRIYKEYPNEMLTSGEYLKRIKEKRGKAYFRKLLQEEEKRSATSIQYFKSFKLKGEKIEFFNPLSSLNIAQYIKVFYKDKKPILAQLYQNSHLAKSTQLNDLGQVKEIIDFETKTIKEYRYGRKNHHIDEIECFYLKDMCRVKEVSKIELK